MALESERASVPFEAADADTTRKKHRRPPRSALQRREQRRRAEVRTAVRLARGVRSLQSHRGCQAPRLLQELFSLSAPHCRADGQPQRSSKHKTAHKETQTEVEPYPNPNDEDTKKLSHIETKKEPAQTEAISDHTEQLRRIASGRMRLRKLANSLAGLTSADVLASGEDYSDEASKKDNDEIEKFHIHSDDDDEESYTEDASESSSVSERSQRFWEGHLASSSAEALRLMIQRASSDGEREYLQPYYRRAIQDLRDYPKELLGVDTEMKTSKQIKGDGKLKAAAAELACDACRSGHLIYFLDTYGEWPFEMDEE